MSERLTTMCRNRIEIADVAITRFKNAFEHDPVNALRESREVFEHIAIKNVCETILTWSLTRTDSAELITTWARHQLTHAASYVPASTSSTSNLIDTYRTSAWARIVDTLEMGTW